MTKKIKNLIFWLVAICVILVVFIVRWSFNNRKIDISSNKEVNVISKSKIDISDWQVKCDNECYQNSGYANIYTDKIINPYTKEEFMIRKDKDGQCGGEEGAKICDLVVRHQNGAVEAVVNLFDIYNNKFYKDGAYLIKFTGSDSLIIGFKGINYGHCDCNGKNESIKELNVKTKKMADILNYMNFGSMSGYKFDEIQTKYGNLIFVSNFVEFSDPRFSSAGVFLEQSGKISQINFSLLPPYDIDFSLENNYQNPESLNIKINSQNYSFDFNTKTLKAI